MKLAPTSFQSVQDWNDEYLTLWPHRYDYLFARHVGPKERPEWQTESRYPLSDRLIKQGSYLYGVRFSQTTRYCMLDIDRNSSYHPARDRFAWHRIINALEPLGLVQAVICTSSYSGGLHLYFPFEEEQKTWAIALVVATLLENAGFKLAPGQLEVFPNCKGYAVGGEVSLYNGHRLPMQAGSYLLNDDLQPVWGDQQTFVKQWQLAVRRNSVNERVIEQVLKAARRGEYRVTGKAEKFLNDLNAEIEQGWTGPGQTNHLLGRIAMRSYIFGHVLHAEKPLEGVALIEDIIATARALPGYEEWCRHQHEIEAKAKDWTNAIERSHYFHYGMNKPVVELGQRENADSHISGWNQQQLSEARERIRQAVAELLEQEQLPGGITERFDALVSCGVSGATLYRHRDLWHPRHLQIGESGDLQSGAGQECRGGAPGPASHTNLLAENGCNAPPTKDCRGLDGEENAEIGCNSLPGEELSNSQPREMSTEEGVAYIKGILNQIETAQKEKKSQRRKRDAMRCQLSLPFGDDVGQDT